MILAIAVPSAVCFVGNPDARSLSSASPLLFEFDAIARDPGRRATCPINGKLARP
jgi:hypothetical protein